MRVRRALALAAALPLLLAGCSEEEPQPKMPKASPTSVSSSSTPTAEPTQEQESPEDFIRRWQAEADAMVVSGDASEFLRISRGCGPCVEYAKRIKGAYKDGGGIRFKGSEVTALEQREKEPPTFVVQVRSSPLTIEVPGQEEQSFPAADQTYRMTLGRRNDEWLMRHYSVL